MRQRFAFCVAMSLSIACSPLAANAQTANFPNGNPLPLTHQTTPPQQLLVSHGTSVVNASQLSSSTAIQVAPGATAIIDFGSNPNLSFSGDIVNSGSIFAISSNPAVTTAHLGAHNIFNNQGALLSSILPASLLSFTSSAVPNLNLSLSAINQIVNAGTISSAGNLAMNAGTIVNSGAINAAQNLNITSQLGTIVNSGIISASAGNLNLSSLAGQNLIVNNMNGVLQSILGNVNFSTASASSAIEKLNMSINGGNILGRELNFSAPSGVVDINTNVLEGTVNINSCGAHLSADTANLILGQMNISGDPTFYNTGGNILISNNLDFQPVQFVSAEVNLAIVAKGDINAANTVTTISTNSLPTPAPGNWPGDVFTGSILIVAGAKFTASPTDNSPVPTTGSPPPGDTTNTLLISGASSTGGSVNLPNVNISSQAGKPGSPANSGNVIIVAYAAGANTGNISVNSVTTGETNVVTNDLFGTNGSVAIIGQGNISVGSINTSGNFLNTSLNSGNILIASSAIDMLQMPVPSNAWIPTQTTLVSPTIYSGVTNTAAAPGNTILTVSSTAGLNVGDTLVLDPLGPSYEKVVVSAVSPGNNQISTQAPLVNYHYASETVYERPNQASTSTTINAGAGVVPNTPIINNNAIFAPNMGSLANGTITISGQMSGTGAVTVATAGAVQVNQSISLSMNPTTATPAPTNYFRLPTINITGSSVTVASGNTVSSAISGCAFCPNSTNISTANLTNNGTIGSASGGNMFVNVSSSGNLAVSGTGTFTAPTASVIELTAADKNTLNLNSALAFNTGSNSLVILDAQGNGGTINVNGAMSFTGSPIVSVNSPNLNPGSNSGFNSVSSGGAFLFGSGYTANPLTLTLNGAFGLTGAPASFTPYFGQNMVFAGTGTLTASNPTVFQTAGGGSITNSASVTLSGSNIYTANNPSGDIQGAAFQPYVGGRISGQNPPFVSFAAYPYQVVLALLGNMLATTDTTSKPGLTIVTPQFQYVSTYTQVYSAGFVIQAAKQLGLRVSAGVFVDVNGDNIGSMTQSAYNTAVFDTKAALAGAAIYGNVIDVVVGNEDVIAQTGSNDASPSMTTLQHLIQGGTINIQFVGPVTTTGAQPLRNSTTNPVTGLTFTGATLPVTTKQKNGVLNLVTDPLPNNSAGMTALMNSLDQYVYGNYYPFFDQSSVVPTLISTPNITQAAFTTLVQNYMTSNFTTNTTNFTTAGISTTRIRVGETGWATPMLQLSSNPQTGYVGVGLPQQSLKWAQWYFPAMQQWSATQVDPLNSNKAGIAIEGYFAAYDEPWKGVLGKNPNGIAVTVGANANAGLTSLPTSNAAAFYNPATLTPMSVVINPLGANQEIQSYFNPQPGNNNLPINNTNFPSTLVNTHVAGESIVSGSPQEPFFGILVATGTNVSTGNIYNLSGSTQQYSVVAANLTQLSSPPTPRAASSASPTLLQSTPQLVVNGLSAQLALGSNVNNTTIIPTDINPERIPGEESDTGDLAAQSASAGNQSLAGAFRNFTNNILPNPEGNSVSLPQGNALFLPDHDIVVQTPLARINISEGAAVMIFQSDSGLSVFNLFDNKTGDVAIGIGDETQELGVGRQLSITNKQEQSLRDIIPDSLAVRNVADGRVNSRRVISSEFSHASAFSNFPGLKKLFNSDDKNDRRKAEQIMKTAAAITLIKRGADPYQPAH